MIVIEALASLTAIDLVLNFSFLFNIKYNIQVV